MTAGLHERAPAKVNLTLRVLGRRADGYHVLDSLVAFADIGDDISLDPSRAPGVTVTGPFGGAIGGDDILARTLELVREAAPQLRLGHVTLDKRLPVASGIGGGSADAAALLRLIERANPDAATALDWHGIAARLGADVPVCLGGRATWMGGIGDVLTPLKQPLPALDVVLVNPLATVPADKTARVFRALGAGPIDTHAGDVARGDIPDRAELIALMRRAGNDLEVPGIAVVPETQAVLDAMEAIGGAELVQMSGAGPTCFAVLPDAATARAYAETVRAAQPAWWIEVARVG
ncbi:MAG: 4-(cytidine 5'-diphospho)-2-C-methyl-D-erythritol kinase [Hyphomicrobium sp.]|nr:4-(cytidine 5'-diphospho)-2-C-methyl-D-erythritol kinase [Hyphomicrobium sp.]